MFKIGDKVAVLDEDFSGVVVGFQNNQILIETPDGFNMAYSAVELIKEQELMQEKMRELMGQ